VKISLYLDEDAQDSDLIQALQLRGVSVVAAWTTGMRERNDEAHLLWAIADHRTLYSFNVRAYYRLHGEFLANGKSHAKIVLAQQRYSVDEQMRRLLKLIEIKSGEEMVNQIEFLSDWE
jgi:hypothetical protein